MNALLSVENTRTAMLKQKLEMYQNPKMHFDPSGHFFDVDRFDEARFPSFFF